MEVCAHREFEPIQHLCSGCERLVHELIREGEYAQCVGYRLGVEGLVVVHESLAAGPVDVYDLGLFSRLEIFTASFELLVELVKK